MLLLYIVLLLWLIQSDVSQAVDKIDMIALSLFIVECVRTHPSVNVHTISCQLSIRKIITA